MSIDNAKKRNLNQYVPYRDLVAIYLDSTKKTLDEGLKKSEIIDLLESEESKVPLISKKTDDLVIQYKFAGRTSISWSVPNADIDLSHLDVEKLLTSKMGNPFKTELHPPITNEPTLNKADWLNPKLIILEFVYSDKEITFEEDYKIKTIHPQKRAHGFIRFLNSPFVIEGRANYRISRQVHEKIAQMLNTKISHLAFSDEDFEALKLALNAKKKAIKVKKSAGCFDTMSGTASPDVADLDAEQEFQEVMGNDEIRKVRLEFDFPFRPRNILKVSMMISSRGNIWFASMVPEEVVDHLFLRIREIKGL